MPAKPKVLLIRAELEADRELADRAPCDGAPVTPASAGDKPATAVATRLQQAASSVLVEQPWQLLRAGMGYAFITRPSFEPVQALFRNAAEEAHQMCGGAVPGAVVGWSPGRDRHRRGHHTLMRPP